MKTNDLTKLEERVKDLTILIATAQEEGDEYEHKEVVREIMYDVKFLLAKMLNEQREEMIKKIDKEYKKERGINNWLDLKWKL